MLSVFITHWRHLWRVAASLIAGIMNLCAILTFIVSGRILWHSCLISMVAAGPRGYIGARYARRLNPESQRGVVVVTRVVIAGYFFWRQR